MNFTKGPWKLGKNEVNEFNVLCQEIDGSDDSLISCLATVYGDDEESKDNVKLILHATEMYWTIREAIQVLEEIENKTFAQYTALRRMNEIIGAVGV